jgi:hypothetical protein
MEDKISKGWISLYKKFTHWEWYKDTNVKTLFIHLLLKASYEDTIWNNIEIKRGQVLTSRKHLSEETGLTEQQIRTSIKKLQSTNEITITSTNKYTLITIEKYDFYQSNNLKTTNKTTNKTTEEITNEVTTSNNIYNNNINNINNKLNKTKLNKLFNFLIYKENNFENLEEINRIAIVNTLKRLELYVEDTKYLPEERIFALQLQYWTITEIYLSPYRIYLNELSRNKFMLKYYQTEKYIPIENEDKIKDFINYFITCLRKEFEKK